MPKIVIVGAGISGLALAFRLQQLGPEFEITILEERDRPGGTVWTYREDGFEVEAGPNGFLDSKPSTVDLCRDLGLEAQLVAGSPEAGKNRYLLVNGRLQRLPGGLWDFLRSRLLSWRGKASFCLDLFRRPLPSEGDESIDSFARRRAGAEAARVFADALVTGIYAGDPRLLSLKACFPRLAALEREHGSILKGLSRSARQRRLQAEADGRPAPGPGRILSFAGGMRLLIERLCECLGSRPLLGVAVRGLHRQENGWSVEGDGKDAWAADAVVLACPAYRQATILAGLDDVLADLVESIPYNRVVVVAMGYRRTDVPGSLAGFGYIAPQRSRRDVLGVQWCSSIFPGRAPADAVLLRAIAGGWHRADVAGWDDERLLAGVRQELAQAMAIQAPPRFHKIVRWNRAIPQYQLGHLEHVGRIQERARQHPGLFLAGNAYYGVALNDCTEQADILARQLKGYFFGPRRPGHVG
jgi:oxygen-dependent protoporphyrinogen oxidase